MLKSKNEQMFWIFGGHFFFDFTLFFFIPFVSFDFIPLYSKDPNKNGLLAKMSEHFLTECLVYLQFNVFECIMK